jgi:acyl-CoA synthetase (AMP-forming)/AMP-acid ligase II
MTDLLQDMVTTPDRETMYVRSGLWDDVRLIDRIVEHASNTPNAAAVVDEDAATPITFRQLDTDSNRVAALLLDRGLRPGDIVAMQLPNWYASVAVAVGVMKVGAVINPLLPIYRERELRHMLGLGSTRFIFTPGVYRDFYHPALVAHLQQSLPDLKHHFVVSPVLDELLELPARAGGPYVDRPAASVAELMFTSGTEAAPKAIMHTERTLNATLRATCSGLGMSASSDSVWMPAPIGHSTGFNHGLRLALYYGVPLILQDRWDPDKAAKLVERHRPTHTLLSTTFLRDLVRSARRGAGDVSSLSLFGCGGAPIPSELVGEAREVGINCLRLYGATEVLVATWNRPGSPEAQRTHTDGLPLPGVEVEVRDDQGDSLVGQIGEIYVRSASASVGFFRDEERTQATYRDGWVRSGDLGVLDSEGYLSITGRRKEIIIRGGLNIAPREIEDLILKIPGVSAVAVIGLPDERLGETACACVALTPGATLTFDQVIDHLRGTGLATFKWPQRLEIVNEMPTTATGKIRKHMLVAQLNGGAGSMTGAAREDA